MTTPLLEVRGLVKQFSLSAGMFGKGQTVRAVDGVTFSLGPGETLAIVGESGSGKTTTARIVLLLEEPTSGSIRFQGEEVSIGGDKDLLKKYRRSVQAVFQDPYSSLSPRMRVQDIVAEPLSIHTSLSGDGLTNRVAELLEQVGVTPETARHYPHQLSGGQAQRIAIARAIALRPALIVLDEPVSALDMSIRAQILNLLVELQKQFDLSYLLISHDLAMVEHMSHNVGVMYAGQLVELTDAEGLYGDPQHPYTQALLAAVPSLDPDVPLGNIVGGEVANPTDLPTGCRFHPRCPLRTELGSPPICETSDPVTAKVQKDPSRLCACHFRGPGQIGTDQNPSTMFKGTPEAVVERHV
jgi:oligopeptide/dipeptide ABC transporter ATP-binding protein